MPDPEFELLWNLPGQALDAPNRRANGTSGVSVVDAAAWPLGGRNARRIYLKRQRAFFCRPVWNAFRRTPTLRREQRFLERARAIGLAVPGVVYYGECGDDRAILALEEVPQASDLERALADANADDRIRIVERVGDALATLHASRILHGAIYPKHVLVDDAEPRRVTLIDFEKARNSISAARAARLDLDRLARHAAFLNDRDWAVLRGRYTAR